MSLRDRSGESTTEHPKRHRSTSRNRSTAHGIPFGVKHHADVENLQMLDKHVPGAHTKEEEDTMKAFVPPHPRVYDDSHVNPGTIHVHKNSPPPINVEPPKPNPFKTEETITIHEAADTPAAATIKILAPSIETEHETVKGETTKAQSSERGSTETSDINMTDTGGSKEARAHQVNEPRPYDQVTPGTVKPSVTGNVSTEKAVEEMKSQAKDATQ